jgi:hypothetical protein
MLYKVVAYIRAEGEPEDYVYYSSIKDAEEEVHHLTFIQDENIYRIEEVHPDELPEAPEIYEGIEIVD